MNLFEYGLTEIIVYMDGDFNFENESEKSCKI